MSRRLLAPLLTLVSVIATALIAVWALAAADGVVHLGGSSYRTEFIDMPVLSLSALAVPLVGVIAWRSWPWALAATAGVVGVHVVAAAETVRRYTESGWGDGLEVFAYLVPVLALVGCLVAVAVGALIGLAVRRRSPVAPARPVP